MGRRLACVATFGVVLCCAMPARAASIFLNTPSSSSLFAVDIPRFDPSLGTLDSVEIELFAYASFVYFNAGTESQPLVATPQFAVSFGGLTLTGSNALSQSLAAGELLFSGASGSNTISFNTGLISFIGAGFVSLVGTGGVDPGIDALLSGPDIVLFTSSEFLDGSVTYNYTPVPDAVPEPATLSLLGLGLGGMAARRWLKRR